ncbi:Olfactory receptor 6P1 [Lemmus lemmus]
MTINQTILKDFILLGFSAYPHVQTFLFVVFFCLYLLTLAGNLTIMGLTWVDRSLHTPMYLFLSALSFSETCYTLTIIPKMLVDLLDRDRHISVTGCGLQLYFFIALACTECVLLAVMAYDRYLAICEPLRYPSLMPPSLATRLATASWGSGFFSSMMKLLFISRLSYCGPNVINHFFCDISPLLNLTCSDKEEAELVDFLLALVMILLPLVAVASSYAAIIVAILRIPTAQGRHKAFSTCTSHLAVVVIYYSSTLFTYARPRAMYSFNYNKIISVLYTVIVPFLNPAIYCLRNKEVKDAFRKTMLGRCHHPREVPD